MDLRFNHYKLTVSTLGTNRKLSKYSLAPDSVPSKPTSNLCRSLGSPTHSALTFMLSKTVLFPTPRKLRPPFLNQSTTPEIYTHTMSTRLFQSETSLWFKDNLSSLTQTLLWDSFWGLAVAMGPSVPSW